VSSDRAGTVGVVRCANLTATRANLPSRARQLMRVFAVTSSAAGLAACAQSSVISSRSGLAPNRQAEVQHHRVGRVASTQQISVVQRRPIAGTDSGPAHGASLGFASFYTEATETASGEEFNNRELTAAHPTLPFGTRLRVTNLATGRSVTVRVNDRGPYVAGRIVDVSYSAAEALGMVRRGVAKVKLDVVH
jgi:rare lipoprotein A